MTDTFSGKAGMGQADQVSSDPGQPKELRPSPVASMFTNVDEMRGASNPELTEIENSIAQIRLGIAGSLFMALRAHHAPTARHSLRVAMNVSSWAAATDLLRSQRDELEVAALLHDVGKLGVSDTILKQPSALTPDQVAIVNRSTKHCMDILSACCSSKNILDIVQYVPAWYDGSFGEFDLSGDAIPVGARMIAIVNAFDAMTTDRVYRKAIPIERAVAELYQFAGTQFDPVLVNHFATIQTSDRKQLNSNTASRWLTELKAVDANQFWRRESNSVTINDELPFHEILFDVSPTGAMYIRADMNIERWSPSLERMTGIPADIAQGTHWSVGMLELRDADGRIVQDDHCPIRRSMSTLTVFARQMQIRSKNGDTFRVDMQVVPVRSPDGSCLGVSVVMRDMSPESNLEERIVSLHAKATRDPLTQVANRAEFDRIHAESVEACTKEGRSFSLIICDIDRFKQVNDRHGHQAGDEALVSFASLLRRRCRKGDLVARYGGEEFVMVCQNCTCSEAAHIAEKIRVELSQTPLAELAGNSVTASFGVTELQPGDTPESMLRRADRGLLEAKDSGRNMVVQLGTGVVKDKTATSNTGWFSSWWQQPKTDELLERTLATNVPVNVAVQKLHGFISDHGAECISINDNEVALRLVLGGTQRKRRRADRSVAMQMELTFYSNDAKDDANSHQTIIKVVIGLIRNRDRRQNPIEDARFILRSLRSYLMALEISPIKPDDTAVKPSGLGGLANLIKQSKTD